MQGFKNVLQLLFYLIWIPLGILLFVLVIFLLFNNPFTKMQGGFGSPPAGYGGNPGGMQADQMMNQPMQMQGQPGQGPAQGGPPQR